MNPPGKVELFAQAEEDEQRDATFQADLTLKLCIIVLESGGMNVAKSGRLYQSDKRDGSLTGGFADATFLEVRYTDLRYVSTCTKLSPRLDRKFPRTLR